MPKKFTLPDRWCFLNDTNHPRHDELVKRYNELDKTPWEWTMVCNFYYHSWFDYTKSIPGRYELISIEQFLDSFEDGETIENLTQSIQKKHSSDVSELKEENEKLRLENIKLKNKLESREDIAKCEDKIMVDDYVISDTDEDTRTFMKVFIIDSIYRFNHWYHTEDFRLATPEEIKAHTR